MLCNCCVCVDISHHRNCTQRLFWFVIDVRCAILLRYILVDEHSICHYILFCVSSEILFRLQLWTIYPIKQCLKYSNENAVHFTIRNEWFIFGEQFQFPFSFVFAFDGQRPRFLCSVQNRNEKSREEQNSALRRRGGRRKEKWTSLSKKNAHWLSKIIFNQIPKRILKRERNRSLSRRRNKGVKNVTEIRFLSEHSVSLCFGVVDSVYLFRSHSFHEWQNDRHFEHRTFHRFILCHCVFAFDVLLLSVSFRSFVTFLQKNLCITELLQCAVCSNCFDDYYFMCFAFTSVFTFHLFGNNAYIYSYFPSSSRNSQQHSIYFQQSCTMYFNRIKMSHPIFHKSFLYRYFNNVIYFIHNYSLPHWCYCVFSFSCLALFPATKNTKRSLIW